MFVILDTCGRVLSQRDSYHENSGARAVFHNRVNSCTYMIAWYGGLVYTSTFITTYLHYHLPVRFTFFSSEVSAE